ncbi:hypothetical protein FB446DRAFT_174773 [Lentinula raphanica]|nr:hypothetical protein FB446DRAFT_174773 [Lentinula raphanica]
MPKATQSSESLPSSTEKIRRPRNAFFIFRCDVSAELSKETTPEGRPLAAAVKSKEASKRWSKASAQTKQEYYLRAQQEKEEHAAKYPGYVYQPRRKEQIQQEKAARQSGRSGRATRVGRTRRVRAPSSATGVQEGGELEDTRSTPSGESSSSFRLSPAPFSPPSSATDSDSTSGDSQATSFDFGYASQSFESREASSYQNLFVVDESAALPYHPSFEGQVHDPSSVQQAPGQINASTSYNALSYDNFSQAFNTMVDNHQKYDYTPQAFNATNHSDSKPVASGSSSIDFGSSTTDLSWAYNTNPALNAATFSFANEPRFDLSSSTYLFPQLDPDLQVYPGNLFSEEEPSYQRSRTMIDPQLEHFRLPSYD